MSLYRCYFRDQKGMQIGWEPIRSKTDAEARKLAARMLRERSDIRRLDAWREADLAFHLSRFDVSTEA